MNKLLGCVLYYAARSCGDSEHRYLFGWVASKDQDKDINNWIWGGTLVVHELVQEENGDLKVKMPDSVHNAFAEKMSNDLFEEKVIETDSGINEVIIEECDEETFLFETVLKQFGHSLREIDIERAIIEALTACKKYKYTIIRDKEGKIIGTYDKEYFSYNYVNDLEENEEKPIEEVILGEIKKQRLKKQESTVVKEPESSVETEGNKESEDKTLIDQEERKRQRDIAFKKVAKEFWRKNIYEL